MKPQPRPSIVPFCSFLRRLALIPLALAVYAAQPVAAAYELTADSRPQSGVPKGEVLHFTFSASKLFPGTARDYWVYVPAQYTPDKPACLYVNQDGLGWNAPTVFDNLISRKEIPVTIGVFVMHGRVPSPIGAALDRFNRSYEYDGLGNTYARFLLEELLPDVETKKTSDGRAIRISHDGNDHAIGGASSGAVCAFTAAWERPDQFSRVFSAIGTYVGLRGADRYPTLIRKVEAKPIRVFLQDGSADQNIYGGDWWMANQMMERALSFAGCEVNHAWGEGGHSGEQGAALFPDAMRWLWKDWPQPVKTHRGGNAFLNEILVPGEGWQEVAGTRHPVGGLTANDKGEVFFGDESDGATYRIRPNGELMQVFAGGSFPRDTGRAFGPDGRLFLLGGAGRLATFGGNFKVVAKELHGSDMVVASSGNAYVVQSPRKGGESAVVLVRPDGRKRVVDTGLVSPGGVTLSPDQTLLYVSDRPTHWVYSYQVHADGTLGAKQPYYWLHAPDAAEDSDARGMCVDRDGRLYVATNMGLQVCDQAGRVNCILPLPAGQPTRVCFGGEKSAVLYAASGGKVYKRRLAIQGAHAWEAPNKPAPPRL